MDSRAMRESAAMPMDMASRDLVVLDEGECYHLLASDSVGRLVFTRHALPAVAPVNYILDGSDVVLRVDPASSLGRSVAGTVVAFEVDDIDRTTHRGWSVIVVGIASMDTLEGKEQRSLSLVPWATGDRSRLLRITPGRVTGRRLLDDEV